MRLPARRFAGASAACLTTAVIAAAALACAEPATTQPEELRHDRAARISLTEVTTEEGLWDPLLGMFGHSSIAGDVNGDGWTDLFMGTFTDKGGAEYLRRGATGRAPDRLLLGGPNGFTVDSSFPEMYARTSGGVLVDLDNDGDQDMVLARNAVIRPNPRPTDPPEWLEPSLILRNEGGRFTVAQEWFRGPEMSRGMRHVGVLDHDGDGLLDLFFVDENYRSEGFSTLLRNTGDLQFQDVTADAGLPTEGLAGLGGATSDLNGDGWADLLVSGNLRTVRDEPGIQDSQFARLFLNDRHGRFEEVDAGVFRMDTYLWNDEPAGVAVGDLNRDGQPDLVFGQHLEGTPATNPLMDAGQPTRVYLHRGVDGDGIPRFEDVTESAGLGTVRTRAPHVEIGDMDNDGWPDILTGVSVGDGTRPAVFRNLGTDESGVPRFANPEGLAPDERMPPPEQSPWEGLGMDRYWATGSSFDHDRDGRLDWFLVEWFPDLPSRLFRNETPEPGRWLSVDIRPQRLAVGAVVEAYRHGRLGDPRHLLASDYVVASTGYTAGVPATAHLGLGSRRKVDLRIRLPLGQGVCDFRGVRADRELRVTGEGCRYSVLSP